MSSKKAKNNPLKDYKLAHKLAKKEKIPVDDILRQSKQQNLLQANLMNSNFPSNDQNNHSHLLSTSKNREGDNMLDIIYRNNQEAVMFANESLTSQMVSNNHNSISTDDFEKESLDDSDDDDIGTPSSSPHQINHDNSFVTEELLDSDSEIGSDSEIKEVEYVPINQYTSPPSSSQKILEINNNNPLGNHSFDHGIISSTVLLPPPPIADNIMYKNGNTISWKADEDRAILIAAQRNKPTDLERVWITLSMVITFNFFFAKGVY